MHPLEVFLNPKTIAVIGASRTPGKVGYTILESLKAGFQGKIYPINPYTNEIAGIQTYSSVEQIPETIDVAIICVRGEMVQPILDKCVKKKVGGIIIVSDLYGGLLENKGKSIPQKSLNVKNVPILGPRSAGVYIPKQLDMFYLSKERLKRPSEGFIGVVTQSAVVGTSIIDAIATEGIGISKFICYGDAGGLTETDVLDYLGKDLATRAVILCIDNLTNGPEFIKVASKVAKIKPVIVLRSGSSQGVLDVYSAAFKQAGLIEVKSTEQLIDFAKILASQPRISGKRIGVITNSEAYGAMAAGSVVQTGFSLPEFSSTGMRSLKTQLPTLSIKNPLDIGINANTENFQKSIECASKECDALLMVPMIQALQLDESVIDVFRDAKIYGKPLVIVMSGSDYVQKQARRLESFGVPVYPTAERAMAALAVLHQYSSSAPAEVKKETKEARKPEGKKAIKKGNKSAANVKKAKKKRQ